jgi:hypothetical protein
VVAAPPRLLVVDAVLVAMPQELEEHPAAMQLRVLSTMAEVSAERNSTLIFPLPVELLRLVDTLRGNGQPTGRLPSVTGGGQRATTSAPPAAGNEAE